MRQYKHGCGQIVCECPAGYMQAGEDPAVAAAARTARGDGLRRARWSNRWAPSSPRPPPAPTACTSFSAGG